MAMAHDVETAIPPARRPGLVAGGREQLWRPGECRDLTGLRRRAAWPNQGAPSGSPSPPGDSPHRGASRTMSVQQVQPLADGVTQIPPSARCRLTSAIGFGRGSRLLRPSRLHPASDGRPPASPGPGQVMVSCGWRWHPAHFHAKRTDAYLGSSWTLD
jgi:hypothetical protein